MRSADIKELQRRMTKNGCTFTRMCGCYVNANKDILALMNETFLNLADEEFFKYLDIAKATTKGKIGNNLVELQFDGIEAQPMLEKLRKSKLKDEDLLMATYETIISSYDYVGNYLILLFHDVYDVITRTNDNEKLDESEDVYEYLLCAICPVCLTKPGLEYNEDENAFLPRVRDWVVEMPETGFIWPAFTDRREDRDAVMFFTKSAKAPHKEFCELFLDAKEFMTHAERQEDLKRIVEIALGDETTAYGEINSRLLDLAEYPSLENGVEKHAVIDEAEMHRILEELEISAAQREKIESDYAGSCKYFGYPTSAELVDVKAANAARKEEELEWQKNRMERLQECLRRAYKQLLSPTDEKELVCEELAFFLGDER